MSDLVILRYIEETPLELVHAAFINLKEAIPNKTVVAIPYSIDILENCSLEQLHEVNIFRKNCRKGEEKTARGAMSLNSLQLSSQHHQC